MVTGGASGLGKATAQRLAAKGSRVVICDLSTSDGAKVAETIGGDTVFIPADVASESDVKNLMDATKEKFGSLNVVVNCAGISSGYMVYNKQKKQSHKLEDFKKLFEVNLNVLEFSDLLNNKKIFHSKVNTSGAFNVICQSLNLITENEPDQSGQRGIIINTASSQAFDGCQGQIALASSSAATMAMTKTLTKELSEFGIRVNTIAVGLFDTPLNAYLPDTVTGPITELCMDFPNRLGQPDEFAHLVQAIIVNQYINGSIINLDANLKINL